MAPSDDRKPPPKRPGASRDRDAYVSKTQTQPRGIPIVKPDGGGDQDWTTPDTGTHEIGRIASTKPERGDSTPIGDVEAERRQRQRVKETNANVKVIKENSETTTTGMIALKDEMNGHVERLDQSIVQVRAEVTANRTETANLADKVEGLGGAVLGAVSSVNDAVSSLNEFQGVVVKTMTERSQTTYELKAHEQKLEAKDAADAKKQARSFWYKVGAGALKILIAGGVVAATAIATHYAERC